MLNRPYEVKFYYERQTGQQKHFQESGFSVLSRGWYLYPIVYWIMYELNIGSAKIGHNSLQSVIISAYIHHQLHHDSHSVFIVWETVFLLHCYESLWMWMRQHCPQETAPMCTKHSNACCILHSVLHLCLHLCMYSQHCRLNIRTYIWLK